MSVPRGNFISGTVTMSPLPSGPLVSKYGYSKGEAKAFRMHSTSIAARRVQPAHNFRGAPGARSHAVGVFRHRRSSTRTSSSEHGPELRVGLLVAMHGEDYEERLRVYPTKKE